jgi:outer membrane immunogenic protein
MFTGRVGYAVDRTLFYVKGGVAAAEFKDNYAITTTVPPINIVDFGTKTNTDVGWIAGGGIEHAFTPHWSGKIEYNYVDLGTTSEKFNVVGPGASVTVREDIHHKLQIVKVGANYKFD